jgi:hypothetical protein
VAGEDEEGGDRKRMNLVRQKAPFQMAEKL